MADNVSELIRDRYDRIDKKLDRIIGLIESLTGRVNASTMARKYVPADKAFTEWGKTSESVGIQEQLNGVSERLDRIERHLDIADDGETNTA